MEHKQGVTRLCENLASIVDRFEGLGEASRNNSYAMFRMFAETADGESSMYLGGSTRDAAVCYRYQTLPHILVDAGFYVLGRGHFSLVLGHDDQPSTAFKLSLKPEDSYVAYAMYCRQNPRPHLPEIRCMIRAQEGQIIALKRYTTFHEGAEVMGYAEHGFPHDSYLFMQYWREAEPTRRDIADAIRRDIADAIRRNIADAIRRNPVYTESYIQALIGIGKHFDGAATFDLHYENLMFDLDTGTFIITDPVSFKKENFNAIERPRKDHSRPIHPPREEAGAIANPIARGFGAGIQQMRYALLNGNPRSLEVVKTAAIPRRPVSCTAIEATRRRCIRIR